MNENTQDIGEWNDITFDDCEIVDDGTAEPEAANQQDGGVSGDGEETHETSESAKGEGTDQSFRLKYLGAEREVTRDEVITYAQKGMDYDRIRTKYTEAQAALGEATKQLEELEADKGALDALKALAAEQNIGFEDFIIQSIAAVEAAKNGTNVKTELPRIKLDFERKAFERQKAEWDKQKDKPAKSGDADSEMQAEIDEFAAAFPEVAADAKVIPSEVWAAKNADPKKSITQHYKEYLDKQKDAEIENLKTRLAQAEQNAINKYRSTGRQDSAGAGIQGDAWDRAWEAL